MRKHSFGLVIAVFALAATTVTRANYGLHRRAGRGRIGRRAARRHRRGAKPGPAGSPRGDDRRLRPVPPDRAAAGALRRDVHARGFRVRVEEGRHGRPRQGDDARRRHAPGGQREPVVVSAEAPVVDTTSTTLGENFAQRSIQTLPTGRNYSSIVQVAPGISSDADSRNTTQSTITVYGSSGAENAFYIDGVNTTGVEYGFQGKELNYEFVQEVDVKTGGYEAEYGRSTGGIVNVITKSGGNEFHGDVFGYFNNDALQATAEARRRRRRHGRGLHPEGLRRGPRRLLLEGPALVLRRLRPGQQHDQTTRSRPRTGHRSCESNEEHRRPRLGEADVRDHAEPDPDRDLLPGSARRHRRDQRRGPHPERRPPDLRRRAGLRRPGLRRALRGDLRGETGSRPPSGPRHQEKNNVGPATAAGDVIQYQDAANNFFQTGGFGLIQEKNFKRDFYGGSLDRVPRQHEIKFGVEYEKEKADVLKRDSGGQQVTVYQQHRQPEPADLHPLLLDDAGRDARPTTPRSRSSTPPRSTRT